MTSIRQYLSIRQGDKVLRNLYRFIGRDKLCIVPSKILWIYMPLHIWSSWGCNADVRCPGSWDADRSSVKKKGPPAHPHSSRFQNHQVMYVYMLRNWCSLLLRTVSSNVLDIGGKRRMSLQRQCPLNAGQRSWQVKRVICSWTMTVNSAQQHVVFHRIGGHPASYCGFVLGGVPWHEAAEVRANGVSGD